MRPLWVRGLAWTLLLASVHACHAPPSTPRPAQPGPEALARGRAAVAPFKQQLQRALQAGIARGPVEAIQTCRVDAPRIAAASAGAGSELGRTSHRLRNPANAPRPWVEPLLASYLADGAELAPSAVWLSPDRLGYVEPIRVQGLCLTCHGEQLHPAVRLELQRLYPADQATGFAEGDFRGVFWAELPAS